MDSFPARRGAAIQILTTSEKLTRKAGSFLGQLIVDPTPMTPAQAEWFTKLAARAGVSIAHVGDVAHD